MAFPRILTRLSQVVPEPDGTNVLESTLVVGLGGLVPTDPDTTSGIFTSVQWDPSTNDETSRAGISVAVGGPGSLFEIYGASVNAGNFGTGDIDSIVGGSFSSGNDGGGTADGVYGVTASASAQGTGSTTMVETIALQGIVSSGAGSNSGPTAVLKAKVTPLDGTVPSLAGLSITGWAAKGGAASVPVSDAILIDASVDVGTSRHAIRSLSTSPSAFAGAVGIGTGATAPARALEAVDAANPQVRLTQAAASHYADLQVDASGNLTLSPSGGAVYLPGTIIANSASLSSNPNGDLLLSSFTGFVGINANPVARMLEVGDSSNPQLRLTQAPGSHYADFSVSNTGMLNLIPSGQRVGINAPAPAAFLHVAGVQPPAVATTPGTGAPTVFQVVGALAAGPSGGDTTITTTGVGGVGGLLQVQSGIGGQATAAAASATGGAGGAISLLSNRGGHSTVAGTGTNTGGTGGALTLNSGPGGNATAASSGANRGGDSGLLTIQAGTGGTASTGSGTNTGGNGGLLNLVGGAGGAGASANGSGGTVAVTGGAVGAGAGTGGTSGGVVIKPGAAGTGTGGNVQIQTAAAVVRFQSNETGLAFFAATPVAKYAATGNATGFVAGAGTAANSLSVWAGPSGASAYTVGDIVGALKSYGLLAS